MIVSERGFNTHVFCIALVQMCGELVPDNYVIHIAKDLPAGLHLYSQVEGMNLYKSIYFEVSVCFDGLLLSCDLCHHLFTNVTNL